MRKKNGFTLVELLAVIVILALILVIAIPSLLSTTQSAKKENFYMYAQNLNEKAQKAYIHDLDNDPDKTNCAVYDIATDLGLPSTGSYEGWVKVLRNPINSGKKRVTIDFVAGKPIQGVYYCISKNATCVPNSAVSSVEGSNKAKVVETIKEGETLCAIYQTGGDNGVLVNSNKECVSYNDSRAVEIIDNYEYNVEVTLTDRNYTIQNYQMNNDNDADKSEFFKTLDSNIKNPPSGDNNNPYKISSPRCGSTDPITYKGESDVKTTNVTTTTTTKVKCPEIDPETFDYSYRIKFNTFGGTRYENIDFCTTCNGDAEIPTPSRSGYTFGGWYYDSKFKEPVEGLYIRNLKVVENKDSGGCLLGYNDINLYAKWDSITTTTTTKGTQIIDESSTTTRDTTNITDQTTTSRDSTEVTTTTTNKDHTDYTILLDDLNVSGYDIGFDPLRVVYTLNVPNSQTSLSITAKVHDATVSDYIVEGAEDLGVGVNNVAVRVYNMETGAYTVYQIRVKRFDAAEEYVPSNPNISNDWDPSSDLPDPALEASNAQLASLVISGYTIPFDPYVYNYDLEVYSEDELKVSYRAASPVAIVSVTGTDTIREESKVVVRVQSQNGYYHKTYTINIKVNKPESNGTKVLRYTAIGLGALTAVLLVFNAVSKNSRGPIFKKKEKVEKTNKDDIVGN